MGTFTENPVIVTGDKRKFSNNFQARQKLDDHHKYVAHLNVRTDLFDIKWIGGHSNYFYQQQTDGDGTAITSMPISPVRTVDPSAINTYTEEREWYSNEITLTSNSDGNLQWIAGVYQSNEDYVQQPFTLTHAGYDELATPEGAPVNQHGNASVFGELEGNTVSSAFFGQMDYQLSDTLKFTIGARQNIDEKEVTEQTRYIFNASAIHAGGLQINPLATPPFFTIGVDPDGPESLDATPLPGAPLPEGVVADYGIDPVSGNRVRDLEAEWKVTVGSLGVDFTPNDDTLIYFRTAKGYRPGGFNAGFISTKPQVDEETVISYELGYKGTIADQLQISASMFLYDFRDQQLSLPALGRCTNPADLSTCTIVSNFFNIPESENKGFEVELTWSPIENLSFLLNYGFLDATIKDGGQGFQNPDDPAALLSNAKRLAEIPGQIDAEFTNENRWLQDISGNSLNNAPEHKLAFNASYTLGLSAGDLTFSGSYVWRDESYSDVFETKAGIVDDYSTVGARLIWTDNEDRYTVILAGSNLTDEDAQDGGGVTRRATPLSGAAGQELYSTYNLIPPRQYTLELQYRFGS